MPLSAQSPVDSALFPTNADSRRSPIHRWFNFIAGFSPEFVSLCIREAGGCSEGHLLDPFAGAGTALLSAQQEGLDSVGYEPHPFFAEMARAKLDRDLTAEDVETVRELIGGQLDRPVDPAEVWGGKPLAFLQKLVPEDRLSRLGGCPGLVRELPERLRPIFHLIVSRVLEAASGSSTDGIYKAPTSTKRGKDVHAALETVSSLILDDLRSTPARAAEATLHQRSSLTEMAPGASICVTSPPYLNNFDFAEMTRMELYFWKWASSWKEITDTVRGLLLTNTTTAPPGAKYGPDEVRHLPGAVKEAADELYVELDEVCKGRSKPYQRLVYPYFEHLHGIWAKCAEALLPEAPIHVVVADSAFYGVHVRLQEFVALSFEELGFTDVRTRHLRVRGDRWALDKRQGPVGTLGEYCVSANR